MGWGPLIMKLSQPIRWSSLGIFGTGTTVLSFDIHIYVYWGLHLSLPLGANFGIIRLICTLVYPYPIHVGLLQEVLIKVRLTKVTSK